MKNTDPKSLDSFREAKREAQTKIAEVICRFEKEYRSRTSSCQSSPATMTGTASTTAMRLT